MIWIWFAIPFPGPAAVRACSSATWCGDGVCEAYNGETPGTCADCLTAPVIADAVLSAPPLEPIEPSHGDLWVTTWADDGALYTAWGDGCGP
ncbi:MAG TPA: hypothetical protein PLV45_14080, partial [bacterium]|nr:hypothetical protein [bacterium]